MNNRINGAEIENDNQKIEIDLNLFFQYLSSLQEEKSVKRAGFKLQKHPSTIRRMITKVEDYLSATLIRYENYEAKITAFGEILLDKYKNDVDNISIEDLVSTASKNKMKIQMERKKTILVSNDFIIPYVYKFLIKNNIKASSISYTWDDSVKYDLIFSCFSPFFCNKIMEDFNVLQLYCVKHKDSQASNKLVIHSIIYHLVKKLIDLQVFEEVLVVDDVFLIDQYVKNQNYSTFIYLEFFQESEQQQFIFKNLGINIKVYLS